LANEYSVAVGYYQNSIRPEHTLELFNYGDSSNKFVVRRNDGGYTDSGYLMIDNPARNQARIQFPTNSTAGGPYGNGMLLIGGGYGNLSSPTFVEFMRINAGDIVPANVQPQFGFNTRDNPSEFFHLKASNQPVNIRLEVDSSNQFTSGLRFFESTTDRGGVLFNSSNDDIVISSYQGSTYGVIPSLTFNGDEIIIGDRSIGSVGYKLIFDANMTQSSPIIVFRNNLVEEGYIQYFMDSRMLIKMNNENHSIDLESDNININGKITNISGNLSVSVDGYINESRICTVANPCLDNVTNITNDLYWRLDSSNSPSTNNWTHEGNFNVDDGEFTAYKNSGTNRINVTSGLNSVTLGTTDNTFAGLYFHNSAGLMLGRESLGDLFINEYGGVGLGNYIIPNDIDLFIYKNTPTIMMYDVGSDGNVSLYLSNQTFKFLNSDNNEMMTVNGSGDVTLKRIVFTNDSSITDNSTSLILKSPDGSSREVEIKSDSINFYKNINIKDDVVGSVILNINNQRHEDISGIPSIVFSGGYSDTQSGTMAGIMANKEKVWNSSTASKDSQLIFSVTKGGNVVNAITINSNKSMCINSSSCRVEGLDVNGNIIANEYYSGDGTVGYTGSCGSGTTLTVKNGLITGCS
jgi:hypothetical protein